MTISTQQSASPKISLTVFCGSRSGTNPEFAAAANKVGQLIARRNWRLVYGGGLVGLMGEIARSSRQHGAPVIGVTTEKLVAKEHANYDCDQLHIVKTMHERKALMTKFCDGFLVLPGGIGTFDEFFETWTMIYTGHHQKPLAVYNQDDFYRPLIDFLYQCVTNGFMDEKQFELIVIDDDIERLLTTLATKIAANENTVHD